MNILEITTYLELIESQEPLWTTHRGEAVKVKAIGVQVSNDTIYITKSIDGRTRVNSKKIYFEEPTVIVPEKNRYVQLPNGLEFKSSGEPLNENGELKDVNGVWRADWVDQEVEDKKKAKADAKKAKDDAVKKVKADDAAKIKADAKAAKANVK